MFKLILEHEYLKPRPAVDTSRFMQHGRVVDAAHNSAGREAGSGALTFSFPSSEVRVPASPAWHNLRALAVQVWLKLDALPGRRQNIIEGDNSFALFVDAQGAVVASFLGLVQGQAALQWNSVSTALHAPSGVPFTLEAGVWTFISFVFDGIGRARIWVDGTLVAVRSDFASGVGSVGAAGVVVGNWTLANQYALMGEIDSVRVWKDDPVAPLAQFYARLGEAERQAWDMFFDCLAQSNQDQMQQYNEIMREMDLLIVEVIRGLYYAPDGQREEFFALLEAYLGAWTSNSIGSPEHVATITELYGYFESFCGDQFAARIQQLTDWLVAVFESAGAECFWNSGIDGIDSEFLRFIEEAVVQFGG